MEDELRPGDVISPSIFAQAEAIAKEEGMSTTGKEPEPIKLNPEDIEWVPDAMMFIVAWKMGAQGLTLTQEENRRLARLWAQPIQRYLGQVKDLDLIIAAGATITVLGGKALEYAAKHPKSDSNRAGSEGEGQDELSERETGKRPSLIRS